jgi:hypothetical protein
MKERAARIATHSQHGNPQALVKAVDQSNKGLRHEMVLHGLDMVRQASKSLQRPQSLHHFHSSIQINRIIQGGGIHISSNLRHDLA